MLPSVLRHLPLLRRSWKPLNFTNQNFVRIPANQLIEEETIPGYIASRYYPTRIGDVLKDRYQVVGKLGFGVTSTVWLARDLKRRRHVAVKLYITSGSMGSQFKNELDVYKRMETASKSHPGRDAIRPLLDSFNLDGPDGQHQCLVHTAMWDTLLDFLHRNPIRRLPSPVLAFTLKRLFLALDFLHTECNIIHTDIKAGNIMLATEDESVFSDLEEQELQHPCPRKEIEGRTVYTTRELKMTKSVGAPFLCDFGSAVPGDRENTNDIQPDIYRAPEVILGAPWTYSVDVWNAGCMIWDVFEGGHLFTGQDPEFKRYRSRAHLAEIVALLGAPPSRLLSRGSETSKFFSSAGGLRSGVPLLDKTSLEEREMTLEGDDRACFLRLVRKLLQWEPEKRSWAKELVNDEWIDRHS
ncbi:CMGC SRPK kinase [Fusarium albosuccineum]|uniref:non-specific serine/threonine protein kinase n=1 Tax=Fusarium albosuccineum TaxID=1237068 RepID=A0A8H4LEA2_9HYPO|nr:CMGC SRPK kinase [Fusarium albosuccineum]